MHRALVLRCVAVVFLSLALFARQGLLAEETVDLLLDLPADHLTSYAVSELQGAAGQENVVPQPDRSFFFFGRELEDGRRLTVPVRNLESIPYAAVFRFPVKRVAQGDRWRDELTLQDLPDIHPIRLESEAQVVSLEKLGEAPAWRIEGRAALPRDVAKPRNVKASRWVREASLTWTAWYRPDTRTIARFRFALALVSAPVRGNGAETTVKRAEQCDWREALAPGTSELRERIATAIDRGVETIKRGQQANGSWPGGIDGVWIEGNTALMLLALIRSGVYGHDPLVVKGFDFVKKQPFRRVYSVATGIMAMEARYTPLEEIRAAEDYLDNPAAFRAQERRVAPEDLEWMQKAVDWLLGMAFNRRSWSYDEPKGRYDNSCTQYALLAFDAAARCGVQIDPKLWRAVAEHFLIVQNQRGPNVLRRARATGGENTTRTAGTPARARGWGYQDSASDYTGGATYTSMTCAGLTGLMVARAWLGKDLDKPLAARIDGSINDGMAWLETHFDPRFNAPRWEDWYFYSMYGIERVGVLAGTKYLGEREWYAEGAMVLCNMQKGGGNWGSYEYDTAFALLFLKKGTVPAVTR